MNLQIIICLVSIYQNKLSFFELLLQCIIQQADITMRMGLLCVLCLAVAVVNAGETIEDCNVSYEDNGACACSSHDQLGPLTCYDDCKTTVIRPCTCVYYDPALNLTVVGNCFFSCYEFDSTTMEITTSAEFNEDICDKYGSLHRTGRFCGQCNPSYGLAAYSYEIMQCIPCQDYGYKNWIKYFAVALLPLTVFYILAVLLSFNVTSSSLNGIVLVIQCITSPVQMNFIKGNPDAERFGAAIMIPLSILCTVNLDLFRIVYTPFCLHPKANVLQILSLDYIVALYPFLLIFITYVLISAHDKQYRLAVWVWRPFKICVRQYRNTWNIRSSLIEIFATFILLSSVKILGVSLQILISTATHDVAGNKLKQYYCVYDGSIEYFGATHLPYALLAIAISSIFVVLPFLLLAVYPCRCFHKCLNHCGPRFQALHVFMDAFQGSYRTHPRDMRCFSAFYLFLRMLMLAQPQIFPSYIMFFTSGILSLASAAAVTIFQPYKVKSHNTMDSVMMLLMGVYFLCYHGTIVLTILGYGHQWDVVASIQGIAIAILVVWFLLLLVWKLLHLQIPQALIRKAKESYNSVLRKCGAHDHDLSNGDVIESFDREIYTSETNRYPPLLGGAPKLTY